MQKIPEEYTQRLRTQLEKFVVLQNEEWQALLPFLQWEKMARKGFFTQIGQVANQIALVLNGSFRQYYEVEAEEKTTYFYFEDMLVAAYFSCLTSEKSLLAIQALEDSELIWFKFSDWLQLCEQYPNFQKLGRKIAEYIALGLESRMVDLLTLSPEDRYLKFLTSNKKRIIERIPQHYIASYLGISPVSLSRIRNRIMKNQS
jgi:CRP-like cAMP-binding protein